MIDSQFVKDNPEVDWDVYKTQQTPVQSKAAPMTVYDQNHAAPSKMANQGNVDISSHSGGIWDFLKSIPGQVENAATHPMSTVRDVGAGVMGGAQRLAATMGEAGQGIASLLTGGYAPRVDIREQLGLGKNNPVHLEDVLASKNNNQLAKAIGQYSMGAASGGPSLVGQIAGNAIWSGIQAEPGERIKDAIVGGILGATPALKMVPGGVKKGIEYMQPGKAAEQFRSTIGEGTSSQNAKALSQRAQFAKQSRQQEALIPKGQLYAQEGGSNVYNAPESSLPEGNMSGLAQMIAPGEQYGESEAKALSKALADYRKTGDIENFKETSEDIFKIPDLSDKAASKIEDALSIPVARDSKYFSDPGVTDPYSAKGKLMDLHNSYQDSPTLANYDALQSALKKELRSMEGRAKVSDTAQPKVDQLQSNISNLNSDKEAFMQTLPENLQNLENEFRQKYQSYAQTYEKGKKETGASITLRRLAEGRHDLVSDNDIVRLFAKPTAADKAAIADMGPASARNALYAALQRVNPGDAEGMANTILDLKRTKGFDNIVTPDMEQWANNMLKQVSRGKFISKTLSTAGSATAGGMMFGPAGAMLGAALPHGAKAAKFFIKHLKK